MRKSVGFIAKHTLPLAVESVIRRLGENAWMSRRLTQALMVMYAGLTHHTDLRLGLRWSIIFSSPAAQRL